MQGDAGCRARGCSLPMAPASRGGTKPGSSSRPFAESILWGSLTSKSPARNTCRCEMLSMCKVTNGRGGVLRIACCSSQVSEVPLSFPALRQDLELGPLLVGFQQLQSPFALLAQQKH